MVSRESTSGSFQTTFCLMPLVFHFEQATLFVGRDSSPAADVHVGLFVRGYGWVRCAKSGSWRTAQTWRSAPQLPQSSPGIGKTSGINLLPVPVQVLFLVLPARFESSLERGLEIRRPKQIHRIVIADWTQCLDNNGEAKS